MVVSVEAPSLYISCVPFKNLCLIVLVELILNKYPDTVSLFKCGEPELLLSAKNLKPWLVALLKYNPLLELLFISIVEEVPVKYNWVAISASPFINNFLLSLLVVVLTNTCVAVVGYILLPLIVQFEAISSAYSKALLLLIVIIGNY